VEVVPPVIPAIPVAHTLLLVLPRVSVEFQKCPLAPVLLLLFAPFQALVPNRQDSPLQNHRQHQRHTSPQTTRRILRMSLQTRMSQLRRGPRPKVPIQLDRRLPNPSVSRKKRLPPNFLAQKPRYRLATSALCIQTGATKKAFSSILKALPGSVVWIRTTRLPVPDSLAPGPSRESLVIVPLPTMFVSIQI
jgi:hypothetical protein